MDQISYQHVIRDRLIRRGGRRPNSLYGTLVVTSLHDITSTDGAIIIFIAESHVYLSSLLLLHYVLYPLDPLSPLSTKCGLYNSPDQAVQFRGAGTPAKDHLRRSRASVAGMKCVLDRLSARFDTPLASLASS
jgi:hypothetical protein